MSRAGLAIALALSLLLGPEAAHAHLVSSGLGPVYDGIVHLFVSLDDLLAVVALALLAGLNGAAAGRQVLFALPAAWLAGGLAGFAGVAAGLPAAVTPVSLLVPGVLAAAHVRLGAAVCTALAALLGLVHGGLNGAGIAMAGREWTALLGITGAVFVLVALTAAGVLALRPAWTRIAVRAAASWIAATGLLMLGWSLSGRA